MTQPQRSPSAPHVRKPSWVVGGIFALIVVSGAINTSCGGPVGTISNTPAVPETQAAAAAQPVDTTQRIPFGMTFTYDDGVGIGIGEPSGFTPSATAFLPAGTSRAVALRVVVANGSAKPLNLNTVSIQASAGDQAVGRVFDATKGVLAVTQTLPPGTRQVFTVVFGVPVGPADFRVQAQPSMVGYQPVFFTGRI